MVEKKRRIGLLGGTFDPVHEGHVAVAEQAEVSLSLDRILFIPAADPPHKKQPGASYSHRVAMLELALEGTHKEYEISLLEAERQAPSYTVDTLLELKKRLGNEGFFFIMGADSLLDLHLWYRFRELPGLTDFIIAARPGISLHDVHFAVEQLPGSFVFNAQEMSWQRLDGAAIYYLAEVSRAVSSSEIRRQLSRGQRPASVNSRVLDYIAVNRLYLEHFSE